MMAWLVICRGVHVAALLSGFGSLLTDAVVVRVASAGWAGEFALGRRLWRITAASLALALASGLAWALGTAASVVDADGLGAAMAALPSVVAQTHFGRVLALRLALLLAAALLLTQAGRAALPARAMSRTTPGWARLSGAALLLGAIVLQPLLSHAGAMGGGAGAALSATEMLHLAAAGAWLGGLLPLALCIAALPPMRAAIAAERFLPIGLASVLVLAGSGAVQGAALIGSRNGLLRTPYGHLALVKLALFAALLGLACLNRFQLAARLRTVGSGRGVLCASVGLESALGLGVVLVAAWLGSTEPAIDILPT